MIIALTVEVDRIDYIIMKISVGFIKFLIIIIPYRQRWSKMPSASQRTQNIRHNLNTELVIPQQEAITQSEGIFIIDIKREELRLMDRSLLIK